MSTAVIEQAKLPQTWQSQARKKFIEYKRAVDAGIGTPEDEELLAAYRQLGMGRTVISLHKAMREGGVDAHGHPVLAVANAAARWVWFCWDAGRAFDADQNWNHHVSAFVSDWDMNPGWRNRSKLRATKTGTFRFPSDYFLIRLKEDIRARVPLVPPALRPKASLDNYVLLWEANWEEAPRDPYLLRRVTQDLFVVLAQWDLTKVERTVLDMATVGAYKNT